MIGKVAAKYALRSLRRHPRRTLLSMLGIGVGVAMVLVTASWMHGATEMQIRAVAESGGGHLRMVPEGWAEQRDNTLRLPPWREAAEAAEALPAVKAAAPRSRVQGLLAFGTRNVGVEIVGVRPPSEEASNRIVFTSSLDGRYLREDDPNAAVIGRAVADRLRVEVDDEIYVTLSGADGVRAAMLRVVGIISTGVRDVDMGVCHVTLDTLEDISGYPGAGEVTLLLHDYRQAGEVQRELDGRFDGAEVITWREVNPAIAANVDGDEGFFRLFMGIIIVVVGLGIVSAQMTAVMERRREIAVLTALGMKTRQVIALVMIEAAAIAVGGAGVALAAGGWAAHWLATRGFDFQAYLGEDYTIGDVLIDPVLYGDFGAWIVPYALTLSVVATVAASLYPAWMASRVEPAESLRL